MFKFILHKFKVFYDRCLELYCIYRSKSREKNKFKNPNRKKIYSKVILTHEQKRDIDILYKENYGSKIPYIWHKHYSAFTGRFDKNYFPELLYIPEFEKFMNLDKEYSKAFSDKNVLPDFAKAVGVKTAKIYLECIKGNYRKDKVCINRNAAIESVSDIGEVFIKPTVDSCSGNGCMIVDFQKGIDTISGKNIGEIFEKLGSDFVIQERIICHPEIKAIYSESVNTFRIMTYRWRDNLFVAPVIMRIGQGGSFLDNAHAGGMFIAVDDDGTLHKTAFTEFNKQFTMHPDSGLIFEGYKISLFSKVISAAKQMHDAIPQVGIVNWDFTIDDDGTPLLIEGNLVGGGIWLFQMAHGKGVFGENTEEILRWMKCMKKIRKKERSKYRFGEIK